MYKDEGRLNKEESHARLMAVRARWSATQLGKDWLLAAAYIPETAPDGFRHVAAHRNIADTLQIVAVKQQDLTVASRPTSL
ncbi:hypothetical protein WJX72_009130 [[Myrmecia] bisecta]|uniref:Uncharacterized protein n=1 Tax=[Myrmecia] bisecta TaxID=41462 RepID=A0AAW1Q603_9CHLO